MRERATQVSALAGVDHGPRAFTHQGLASDRSIPLRSHADVASKVEDALAQGCVDAVRALRVAIEDSVASCAKFTRTMRPLRGVGELGTAEPIIARVHILSPGKDLRRRMYHLVASVAVQTSE